MKLRRINKKRNTDIKEVQNTERNLDEYYVYADYFPPERHEICIDYSMNNLKTTSDFYHLDVLVPYREGEFPVKQKRIKKRMVLRRFNKNNSVFKNWKVDTDDKLKKAFDLDVSYSKIQKF